MFEINSYNELILYGLILCIIVAYLQPRFLFSYIKMIFPNVLFKKESNNTIYLTFDDVPHNQRTFKNILDELKKHKIKATFFVIGSYVDQNNCDMLVEAVQSGHELGNHGYYDHVHALVLEDDLIKEIDHTDCIIRSIYRKAKINLPNQLYFRPGSGFITFSMERIVKSLSYKIVLGSVYPHDTLITNYLINCWYLINRIKNGDIVILHDRPNTQKVLQKVLPYLIEKKHHFQTLNHE